MKKHTNMVAKVRYWEGLDFGGYMELIQNVDMYTENDQILFIEPFSIDELGQKWYYNREKIGDDVEIIEVY